MNYWHASKVARAFPSRKWRKVGSLNDDATCLMFVGRVVNTRDAEVSDLQHESVDVDEKVGGAEVAVNDVGAVDVLQDKRARKFKLC